MKKLQKRKIYIDKPFAIAVGIILLVIGLPIITLFIQQRQTIRQQAASGSIPLFSHVFVIIEENKDYSQIIGSSNAPYINQLASQYGSAANFFAEAHPSLPNYIALTSGGTQGITDDCNTCFVNVNSIFQEVEKIGKTWKSYHEDMPSNCYTNDVSTYVMHHNSAAYYTPIKASCAVNDVPYSQFAPDLAGGKVGNLTFIIPNNNNEMHDGTIQQGDTWLQQHLPAILNSQAYKQNGLIILTWDEDSDNGGTNQIATILISPFSKQKYKSSVRYDHYSLLRTISDGLGVPPLGAAATAPAMSDFFAQSASSAATPPNTVTGVVPTYYCGGSQSCITISPTQPIASGTPSISPLPSTVQIATPSASSDNPSIAPIPSTSSTSNGFLQNFITLLLNLIQQLFSNF